MALLNTSSGCPDEGDRQKMEGGIRKACEKRPIGMEQIGAVVREIERQLKNCPEREVSSLAIGTKIMEALKNLSCGLCAICIGLQGV